MKANQFRGDFLATAIGSLPHQDVGRACDAILRYLPAIPFWPQLPRLGPLENMYIQFCSEFPGVQFEDGVVYGDTQLAIESGLEGLYENYLTGDTSAYGLSDKTAAGFSAMLGRLRRNARSPIVALKGQVTGPISQCLQMTDRSRRPVLYDDVLADAVAKHLRLVAAEQERQLAEVAATTVMFVDEPYLQAIGSAFIQLSADQVVRSLEEVLGGLSGLKGIHVCANTDWGLLMSTSVDIINFDALRYGDSLALYAEQVGAFIRRGGLIAWGIVPNDEGGLAGASPSGLAELLLGYLQALVSKGLVMDDLVHASLVTPTCGLAPASEATADAALALLADLSKQLRIRFGLEAKL